MGVISIVKPILMPLEIAAFLRWDLVGICLYIIVMPFGLKQGDKDWRRMLDLHVEPQRKRGSAWSTGMRSLDLAGFAQLLNAFCAKPVDSRILADNLTMWFLRDRDHYGRAPLN